jgi:hypothetical protein
MVLTIVKQVDYEKWTSQPNVNLIHRYMDPPLSSPICGLLKANPSKYEGIADHSP